MAASCALVTGASRGLGKQVALDLASEGRRVLACMRRPRGSRLGAAEVEELDVASPKSIDALVRRLTERGERLDILVNNAGVYQATAREVWDVNVRGTLILTRGLLPLLNDGAQVVLVSSGLAQSAATGFRDRLKAPSFGWPQLEAMCEEAPGGYSESKAALNKMAEMWAGELRGRGIRVNAVSPGWVRTDMGGSGAPRSIEQGTASILWGCHLGAAGPTGGFFEDGQQLGW